MNSYVKSVDVCLSILSSINRYLEGKRVDIESLVKASPSVIHVMSNVVPVVMQMVNQQLKLELKKIGYPPAPIVPIENEDVEKNENEVEVPANVDPDINDNVTETSVVPVVTYAEPTIIEFLDICDIYCNTSLKLKDQVRIFEKNFLPLNKDILKCDIKENN